MKNLIVLVVIFTFGFSCPAYPAAMSQVCIAEIIHTQISFDAKITFGDRRYLYLRDYPDITQKAIMEFVDNPYKNMGPLFDCEDIARAAQIRFILVVCELLPKLKPNILWHGVPVGTVIFGNSKEKHVINIVIYNKIAIMYDVGWKRFWTVEDIEDSNYEIIEITF